MNPLTRRAERWADEARRLGRIARNEDAPRRIIGYLHDLGCKPWKGCECEVVVVYGDDDDEE